MMTNILFFSGFVFHGYKQLSLVTLDMCKTSHFPTSCSNQRLQIQVVASVHNWTYCRPCDKEGDLFGV